MELLEFSGELTGLMKAQEDAETITVPVVLVKRAVGVCDELKQVRCCVQRAGTGQQHHLARCMLSQSAALVS